MPRARSTPPPRGLRRRRRRSHRRVISLDEHSGGAQAGRFGAARPAHAARRRRAVRGLHDPPPARHEVPRRLLRVSRRQGRCGGREPRESRALSWSERRGRGGRPRQRRAAAGGGAAGPGVLVRRRARAPRGNRVAPRRRRGRGRDRWPPSRRRRRHRPDAVGADGGRGLVRRAARACGLVRRLSAVPLSLALRHAEGEPHPLQRGVLPVSGAGGPDATALHRGDVELWAAHADLRHKFHGIIDRIDHFWERFDWTASRWR
jgi:hypothetical protein